MIKLSVIAVALLLTSQKVKAEAYSSAVNQEIVKTAQDICTTIKELRGRATDTQLQVDVQGKISGLLSKLADVSGGAKGSISRGDFEGLTRDATAIAVNEDRACRERIFNKMFDKLGSVGVDDKEQKYRTALSRLNFFTNRHVDRSYVNVENGVVVSAITNGRYRGIYSAKASSLSDVVTFGGGADAESRVFWECVIGLCVEKRDASGNLLAKTKLMPIFVDVSRDTDLDDISSTLDTISAYQGG